MRKLKRLGTGFTLVELLVALTIALVAILAATELYVGTRQTSRMQGIHTRVSEDGRFAVMMLQRILSQAGYRPAPALALAGNAITPTSNTAMVVRFIADGSNQIACDGSLPVLNSNQSLTITRNNGKLQCGAVDWITPSGTGVELVDFKLDYGLDNTPTTPSEFGCGPDVVANVSKVGDCVADEYDLVKAQAAPAQIVAVKVCVILRSELVDSSVDKAAAYKDCSNGDIANSQTDQKLYRTFRTTVLLRNR